MVRIRLTRMGRKHQPFYRIAVMPKHVARDSKAIEYIGTYSPFTKEVTLKNDRAEYWLSVGAQPSETVTRLLVKEKVMEAPKFQKKYNAKPGRKAQERAEAEANA